MSADLTEARKALDQFVNEARKGVAVPVGSSGGGGAGFVPGVPGTSGQGVPTAVGVLSASTVPGIQQIATPGVFSTTLGSALGQYGFAPMAGAMAPMASPGFAGFGGGAAPVAGAVLGGGGGGGGGVLPLPIVPGTPGGAPAAGGRWWNTRLPFGRFIGVGSALFGLGRIVEAAREYNIDRVMAGGDQESELDATLKYRESLVHSFGPVSRFVGYLQDPSGMAEAAVRGTVAEAHAVDAQTIATRRAGALTERLRDVRTLSQPGTGFQVQMRAAEVEHQQRLRDIQREAEQQEAANVEVVRARRIVLESTRAERSAAGGPSVELLQRADEGEVSELRHNLAERVRGRRTTNQNIEAEIDVMRRNRIQQEQQYRIEDTRNATKATLAALERTPLRAEILGLEAQRAERLREKGPEEQRAVNQDINARIALATQQYNDDRELRLMGLQGRGRVLGAALAGGRYADFAARTVGITEDARLQAERLRRDDPAGEADSIRQIYRNAQDEQQLLVRDFLRGFRPTEIDINRTDLSGQGNNEVLATLKTIADNTAALKESGGGFGAR